MPPSASAAPISAKGGATALTSIFSGQSTMPDVLYFRSAIVNTLSKAALRLARRRSQVMILTRATKPWTPEPRQVDESGGESGLKSTAGLALV